MNALTETTENLISEWIKTDERQYMRVRKDLGEAVFEFAEGVDINGELYSINAYIVDYNEFTEKEILEYIQPYDYESIEVMKEIYGEDYKQIVCECIFESIEISESSTYRSEDREKVKALFKERYGQELIFDADDDVEEVKNYLKSLGHYKNITFVKDVKGDCMYFDAINPHGEAVSIRADVETEVGVEKWNIYDCGEEYEWSNIVGLYN